MKLTMRVEIERQFIPAGLTEYEVAYPQFDIVIDYKKGLPASTCQISGAPIYPADPPEIDLVEVKLANGDGLKPDNDQMWDWVQNWLDTDAGFQFACEKAENHES